MLFSGLQGEEAFFRPPYHGLRHPFLFYYSHVAGKISETFFSMDFRVLCELLYCC